MGTGTACTYTKIPLEVPPEALFGIQGAKADLAGASPILRVTGSSEAHYSVPWYKNNVNCACRWSESIKLPTAQRGREQGGRRSSQGEKDLPAGSLGVKGF